jgi:hypothetical protein
MAAKANASVGGGYGPVGCSLAAGSQGEKHGELQVPTDWGLAGHLLSCAVLRGASRQVSAAIATALWRAVRLEKGPCSEAAARLACIEPVIRAKLDAAAAGQPAGISGSLRAARNVAEHDFEEPIAVLVAAAKRSQRAGRGRRKTAVQLGGGGGTAARESGGSLASGEEVSSSTARSEDEPELELAGLPAEAEHTASPSSPSKYVPGQAIALDAAAQTEELYTALC